MDASSCLGSGKIRGVPSGVEAQAIFDSVCSHNSQTDPADGFEALVIRCSTWDVSDNFPVKGAASTQAVSECKADAASGVVVKTKVLRLTQHAQWSGSSSDEASQESALDSGNYRVSGVINVLSGKASSSKDGSKPCVSRLNDHGPHIHSVLSSMLVEAQAIIDGGGFFDVVEDKLGLFCSWERLPSFGSHEVQPGEDAYDVLSRVPL